MPDASPKTFRQLIALGADFLKKKGVENATVAMELLVARLTKCGRGTIHAVLDTVPSAVLVEALRRGMSRVASGEPVQYVLGQWDFCDLTLKVDKRALIPRPETEQLVEWVLQSPLFARNPKPFVVDFGTGTGCIILSIAKARKEGVFLGIDVSPDAIALAKENAALLGLADRVKFAEGDGCGEFDPASIDLLVSNPPYIPTATVDALPPLIREHEPRLALDGGPDGLDIYRSLVGDAVMVLKTGGELYLEIGDEQGPAIHALLEEYGFTQVEIRKDLAGHDRFARAVQAE